MSAGAPTTHESAHLHVSGEALYADDVALPPNTLHAAFGLDGHGNGRDPGDIARHGEHRVDVASLAGPEQAGADRRVGRHDPQLIGAARRAIGSRTRARWPSARTLAR